MSLYFHGTLQFEAIDYIGSLFTMLLSHVQARSMTMGALGVLDSLVPNDAFIHLGSFITSCCSRNTWLTCLVCCLLRLLVRFYMLVLLILEALLISMALLCTLDHSWALLLLSQWFDCPQWYSRSYYLTSNIWRYHFLLVDVPPTGVHVFTRPSLVRWLEIGSLIHSGALVLAGSLTPVMLFVYGFTH